MMATPLRLILMPPEVMMTNRVVRHFGEEYALRCVFRDDNGQRLVVNDFTRGRAVQGLMLDLDLVCFLKIGDGL